MSESNNILLYSCTTTTTDLSAQSSTTITTITNCTATAAAAAFATLHNNSSSSSSNHIIDNLIFSKNDSTTFLNSAARNTLNWPYTIFEILVALVAVIGNAMVIIVFQKERRLRRRTNYYIVSLAIADFLVGLLGIPFAIMASVGLPTNLHACLFTISLLVVLCTISIFCLVAVSVDRYWAILHPMAYSRNVRTKTAIVIISLCWAAGSIVGFLPLFGWHQDQPENTACLFVEVMSHDYLVFLYFGTIITPSIILAGFYAHIYRVIIKQLRQIVTMNPTGTGSNSRGSSLRKSMTSPPRTQPTTASGGTMLRVLGAAQKREVKATQNLSIIVLFFMICWIPLYTTNCIMAFCRDCDIPPIYFFVFIILSHLNSAVNPILYAYHLRDFRAALKNLIMKLFGVEMPPQPDVNHRLSVASQQQRLQSMLEKRASFQNRVYIESPIWLRQQRNLNNNTTTANNSPITCSLSSVHQTVAAVASVTADTNREMWRIAEVPSTAEESSKNFNENSLNDTISIKSKGQYSNEKIYQTPISSDDSGRNSSINNEKEYCLNYDGGNYNEDEDDVNDDSGDDDVFMPPLSPKIIITPSRKLSEPAIIFNNNDIHLKNRKENLSDARHYFSTELPYFRSNSLTEERISLPTLFSSHKCSQPYNLSKDNGKFDIKNVKGNIRYPCQDISTNSSCSISSENLYEIKDSQNSSEPSVFLVENDKIKLSPSHYLNPNPSSIKSSKIIPKRNKKIKHNLYNNNHSGCEGGGSGNKDDKIGVKPSPLKVVSNYIFPPNSIHQTSGLFSILDRHKNINNPLKRSISDS